MTFNPFRWTFRSQCLAGFAACAALIGFAIYSQFAWGLEPCPMCIFQRLAFAALGLVFLVAGLHAPRTPGSRHAYGILGFLAAAVGMALAGRHVWLQLNPPEIPGCLPPLSFMRETMSTTGVIRRVLTGSGDCSAVDWSFLGLSMPAWSLVWFVLLGLFFLVAAFRTRRRGQR
ncbi:disulfide bond formation protein B [Luteimonas sp. MC1750]|uniref:disulfide bond formation protein B n=1 Tax=Luteimonas sp. MC1750 TaxID=2799326 RepID=UPI0018F08367|nr:disulfide bond formation protein B [Luteimonas sp. MC1750]MBJ6985713.1 disulfide bond formation protein B [Luteimonas sp. MC1750]QQO05258.1 disulfide bond formation protein B [Luteimonas sp. MC1750]